MVRYAAVAIVDDVRGCERRMGRDRKRVLAECDFCAEVVGRERGGFEQARMEVADGWLWQAECGVDHTREDCGICFGEDGGQGWGSGPDEGRRGRGEREEGDGPCWEEALVCGGVGDERPRRVMEGGDDGAGGVVPAVRID